MTRYSLAKTKDNFILYRYKDKIKKDLFKIKIMNDPDTLYIANVIFNIVMCLCREVIELKEYDRFNENFSTINRLIDVIVASLTTGDCRRFICLDLISPIDALRNKAHGIDPNELFLIDIEHIKRIALLDEL